MSEPSRPACGAMPGLKPAGWPALVALRFQKPPGWPGGHPRPPASWPAGGSLPGQKPWISNLLSPLPENFQRFRSQKFQPAWSALGFCVQGGLGPGEDLESLMKVGWWGLPDCTIDECTDVIVMRYTRELGYVVIIAKQKRWDAYPYLTYETPAEGISRRDPSPLVVSS